LKSGRTGFQNQGKPAGKNVHIIDAAFVIHSFKGIRRFGSICRMAMPDQRTLPGLYMHDGQNVFDDATSFAGEWGVDECIDSMKKKCIGSCRQRRQQTQQ
jgi:alpha-glucosidase